MEQPRKWIETVQDVIVIRPGMTPDDWAAVIAAMGISQETIDRAVAALIEAAGKEEAA
jgi:hypothetical protein